MPAGRCFTRLPASGVLGQELVQLRGEDLVEPGLRHRLPVVAKIHPQIDRLVRAKVLHRIRYGAYVRTEVWESLSPEDRHEIFNELDQDVVLRRLIDWLDERFPPSKPMYEGLGLNGRVSTATNALPPQNSTHATDRTTSPMPTAPALPWRFIGANPR